MASSPMAWALGSRGAPAASVTAGDTCACLSLPCRAQEAVCVPETHLGHPVSQSSWVRVPEGQALREHSTQLWERQRVSGKVLASESPAWGEGARGVQCPFGIFPYREQKKGSSPQGERAFRPRIPGPTLSSSASPSLWSVWALVCGPRPCGLRGGWAPGPLPGGGLCGTPPRESSMPGWRLPGSRSHR